VHLRGPAPEPVFVDRTGRRRRLFAAAGAGGALLLALATLVLVAGFTGAGAGSLPALPQPAASKVRSTEPAAAPPEPTRAPAPSRTPATERPADRVGTAPAKPAATSPPPTATPSPTRKNNRRVPTHTPSHKPKRT
jgi:hypothetical protein